MKNFLNTLVLATALAPLSATPTATMAKAPKLLPDAPLLTMNRAREGVGTLKLGAEAFIVRGATLVLVPKSRAVEVMFDTTRGRLLLVGTATRWDNDTVAFSLSRASGPLSRALGPLGRATGQATGQAQLAQRRRTFSSVSLSGKIGARTIEATFRSGPSELKRSTKR